MERQSAEFSGLAVEPASACGRSMLMVAASVAALALCVTGSTEALAWATKYARPTATCGDAAQASTDIRICGGPTGAPYGVELQWMLADNFTGIPANFPNHDCLPGMAQCMETFRQVQLGTQRVHHRSGGRHTDGSGRGHCLQRSSAVWDEIFISSSARGSAVVEQSNFTPKLTCGTLPCSEEDSCTYTQGYWKTHGPDAKGGNANVWPVNNLYLGTPNYIDAQLQDILDKAPAGNGLVIFAHQLIAAKLNVANGADDTDVAATITAADALIGALADSCWLAEASLHRASPAR